MLPPSFFEFPFTLPQCPLTDRAGLPVVPCVYFLIGGGVVQYIGRTPNLLRRCAQDPHGKVPIVLAMPAPIVSWFTCADEEMRFELEKACVAAYDPPLNEKLRRKAEVTVFLPSVASYVIEHQAFHRYLPREIWASVALLRQASKGVYLDR